MTIRGAMVAMIFMLAAGPARAEASVDCDLTVEGAGQPAIDVPAVKAAVNGPHASTHVTVCLLGTFDFGPGTTDSFVSISPRGAITSLAIVGLDGATILRGFQPLRHDPASTLLSLTIRDLHFVGPFFTAISIFRGGDRVEIIGNHVDGVQTARLTFGTTLLTLREGITVTSAIAEIRGQIRIADNVVDGGSYAGEPTVNVNVGILIAGLGTGGNAFGITAEVTVARNLVTRWPSAAIGVQGPGNVTLEGNLVEPGALANTVNPATCVATGIALINHSGATVKNNTIHKDAATRADGSTPVCSPAILLAAAANDNLFVANRITGAGSSAVVMAQPAAAAGGERNVFIGNNATGFAASVATIDLGSRIHNTVVGNAGTVAGTRLAENSITGLTPVAGGVGDAVSGALGP